MKPQGPSPVPPADPGVLDAHVELLHSPMSVISEQFRTLRRRIERAAADGDLRCLAVTSATKGEGKSVTAVNLALALAQDGKRSVLLLEADLRRPRLSKMLALSAGPGIGDLLDGTATREQVLRESPHGGIYVATAGEVRGHPAERLAGAEFQTLLRDVRERFDFVVLDCPPIHPISDMGFVVDCVDAVLLVVRAGKTPKGLLKHAAESIPRQKLLGAVLNRSETVVPGHGYGYGYEYEYAPEAPSAARGWKRILKSRS